MDSGIIRGNTYGNNALLWPQHTLHDIIPLKTVRYLNLLIATLEKVWVNAILLIF